MTAPRCDGSPWLTPREREPDPRDEEGPCDDGIDGDDSDDDFGGRFQDA